MNKSVESGKFPEKEMKEWHTHLEEWGKPKLVSAKRHTRWIDHHKVFV